MEGCQNKYEAIIKPMFLKAGIPLAVTVAGFILARVATRKDSSTKANSPLEEARMNPSEANITGDFGDEDGPHSIDLTSPLETELGDKISTIKSVIEGLRQKESRMEMIFLRFCELKEQESKLMEMHNKLSLELGRVELLEKEISLIDAGAKRFEEAVMEYLEVLEQLECSRTENKLLGKRVTTLLRKKKEHVGVIRKLRLQIETKEAKMRDKDDEIEEKTHTIVAMENENRMLQTAMAQLQAEKDEPLAKTESAEKTAPSKIKHISVDDYNHIINEVEQLRRDHLAEVKELVDLRWCNACLRHQTSKGNQKQGRDTVQEKDKANESQIKLEDFGDYGSDHNTDESNSPYAEPGLTFTTGAHSRPHLKRQKFIEKLKRWMDGSEKMKQKWDKKRHHETKCFGKHCDFDEQNHPARKSCSSA